MANIRTENEWNEDRVNIILCISRMIDSQIYLQQKRQQHQKIVRKVCWMEMNERKAQINCTYIYYVSIHPYTVHTHTLYTYNGWYSTRLFCGIHSEHSLTYKHRHCRHIFMAVFIHRKITTTEKEKSFAIRRINWLWFRYVAGFRPHSIAHGWHCWASNYSYTWRMYHMRVLLFFFLFIHTKRIIINRSTKSIKLAISWWPYTILAIAENIAT